MNARPWSSDALPLLLSGVGGFLWGHGIFPWLNPRNSHNQRGTPTVLTGGNGKIPWEIHHFFVDVPMKELYFYREFKMK